MVALEHPQGSLSAVSESELRAGRQRLNVLTLPDSPPSPVHPAKYEPSCSRGCRPPSTAHPVRARSVTPACAPR
jgi:hypothetical protein